MSDPSPAPSSDVALPSHPTARTLIRTTVDLIEANGPQSITIDQVLTTSGVSRGSLYHHFGDFPTLVDHALLEIFTELTDATLVSMDRLIGDPTAEDYTLEKLRTAIHAVNAMMNTDVAERNRTLRTWATAQALVRPSFRALIAAQQERYDEILVPIIGAAQDRGWLRPGLDLRAIALLVQAYGFGTSVNEISTIPVDRAVYTALIDEVIDRAILVEEEP